jgi:TonB family protein
MEIASMHQAWEGRMVDGRFALLEWLGGSADRGVFLTIRQGAQKAAIKLILAGGADADAYMAQWEAAKGLSHPHLMRVLETGRCAMDGVDLVYVVTEHANEVLSRTIQEIALNAEETTRFLDPVLDALSYLHEKGIVHGHVKPSNILVVADELKLSVDDFLVVDGVKKQVRSPNVYDAPEVMAGTLTAAVDTWAVGMTVAEAMTQHPLVWNAAATDEPVVPESLPRPFLGVVRECLRVDPERRCTIGDIKARLNSSTARPMGDQPIPVAASPMPVRAEPPRFQVEPIDRVEPLELPPLPTLFTDIAEANASRFPVLPLLLGVVVVLAFIAVLVTRSNKLKPESPIQRQSASAPNPSQAAPLPESPAAASSESPSQPQADQAPPPSQLPATAPSETSKAPSTEKPVTPPQTPAPQSNDAEGASVATQTVPKPESMASPALKGGSAVGAVDKQVLPDVSRNATGSMRGPVEVVVRVSVDKSGAVSNAAYVTPGPGNYFARIAVRAAQQWQFRPTTRNGHPEASTWTLRFHFERRKTEVGAVEEGR